MMMLVDKGFYDYDYKQHEKRWPQVIRTEEQREKSFNRFFGRKKKPTADELQKIAMNELDNK